VSLSVVAGQPFTADADFGPGFTGLATVGVRILDSLGAVVQARTTSGVAESPAGTGDYVKTFSAAPSAPGSYRLEWDTGGGSPQYAFEDLIVTGASITSVANAQAWLRRNHVTGTMATDDVALLTIAIKGVSAAIARYTSREFVDPSGNNTDVSRTFDYDGGGYLDFAPYDLRSITSITLGGSALTAAPAWATATISSSHAPAPWTAHTRTSTCAGSTSSAPGTRSFRRCSCTATW
jgi:hypothetical protein